MTKFLQVRHAECATGGSRREVRRGGGEAQIVDGGPVTWIDKDRNSLTLDPSEVVLLAPGTFFCVANSEIRGGRVYFRKVCDQMMTIGDVHGLVPFVQMILPKDLPRQAKRELQLLNSVSLNTVLKSIRES